MPSRRRGLHALNRRVSPTRTALELAAGEDEDKVVVDCRERWGARLATSLLVSYAGLTTAKCIGPVTKWAGENRRV
jgi:hypothetical protein